MNTLERAYELFAPSYSDCPDYSIEYIADIFSGNQVEFKKGMFQALDKQTTYINVAGNIRRTCSAPETAKNTIFIIGSSIAFSAYSDDFRTTASRLQENIIRHKLPYKIINHGVDGVPYENHFLKFISLDIAPGDLILLIDYSRRVQEKNIQYILAIDYICKKKDASFVFIITPRAADIENPSPWEKYIASRTTKELLCPPPLQSAPQPIRHDMEGVLDVLQKHGCRCIDTRHSFQRPHEYGDIFIDHAHMAVKGEKVLADRLFTNLFHSATYDSDDQFHKKDLNKNFSNGNVCTFDKEHIAILHKNAKQWAYNYFIEITKSSSSISKWISSIQKYIFPEYTNIGCIVMNCNPFTKGHLYLIEESLKKVDALYIFCVEEDKSFFSFSERITMIKKGTQHLASRISVIPSGKFIISTHTFPEYFSKEEFNVEADPTADILIFCGIISRELNIKHRFVGEEPTCRVTRSYNDTMLRILPDFDIAITVIPRMIHGDSAISASRVRHLLKNKNWTELEKLTPATTFHYLKRRYASPNSLRRFPTKLQRALIACWAPFVKLAAPPEFYQKLQADPSDFFAATKNPVNTVFAKLLALVGPAPRKTDFSMQRFLKNG